MTTSTHRGEFAKDLRTGVLLGHSSRVKANPSWKHRHRPSVLLTVCLLFVCSCSRSQPGTSETSLAGEWNITLNARQMRVTPGDRSQIQGRVVFDSRLPSYGVPLDSGTSLGRAYIDVSALSSGREAQKKIFYASGDDADLLEEVNATIDSAGQVTIEVSPQIFGRDPVLTGRLRGSVITGTWVYYSHSDTLASGTFEMERVRRSEVTDSALTRAQRTASKWPQARH